MLKKEEEKKGRRKKIQNCSSTVETD